MTPTSIESLSRRFDDLHREYRRFRRIASCVAAVGLLAGLGFLLMVPNRTGRVEARELVLKDESGQVRARLGLDTEGNPELALRDGEGHNQISLRSVGNDLSSLAFSDAGQPRARLDSTSNGSTSFRLFDRENRSISSIFMAPDGTNGLSFSREKRGIAMGVRDDLGGAVYTTDSEGKENGRIGSPKVDAQSLGLHRSPSVRPSLRVMATPDVVD